MPILNIAVAFNAVAKKNDGLLAIFAEEMPKVGIDNPLRICHFLAQLSHESAGFTIIQENLNYSATGLLKVFPKYFKDGLEVKYARNPRAIAARVYANRMGNADEKSEEGWKYRGRGYIQLTGKDNYRKYSKILFRDNRLVENPDLACEASVSVKIACAFWNESNCNDSADKDDVDGVSDLINLGRHTPKVGDAIGYLHRKELTDKAKNALGI